MDRCRVFKIYDTSPSRQDGRIEDIYHHRTSQRSRLRAMLTFVLQKPTEPQQDRMVIYDLPAASAITLPAASSSSLKAYTPGS